MLSLIWKQSGNTIRDGAKDGKLIHPIAFPGRTTEAQEVVLMSSARFDQTFETLTNLRLFLQGPADQLNTLLNDWPVRGQAFTPARADLNGGLEISFNRGVTYHRFGYCPACQKRHGDPDDPSTWLTVPSEAITPTDSDGNLGSMALARMLIRYVIPPDADKFGIFDVRIEPAFDVI
jgi:hypothetical protein